MTQLATSERREITVRGIVQGVGFRPFIYSLARRYHLTGVVRNDADGVTIEAEGPTEELTQFLLAITEERPPLAIVDDVSFRSIDLRKEREFRIEESRQGDQRRALISPDVATCDACLRELFDPADRRYRYPFINCTNCGPRFTITRSVPYDRAQTTMAGFQMCPACQREYDDPADRRFHAQPNACPVCGPRVRLLDRSGAEIPTAGDPIRQTADLLRQGVIIAVKGVGGFHLACDPFNSEAVDALRGRKVRQDKPFALMALDPPQAEQLCHVSPEEASLLTSPAHPIVLLPRRDSAVAPEVAPRQKTLGVMLAYTPLHHLLLHDAGIPLVMTSGNRSDEPIAYRDDEAFEQLGSIADYFLLHDRPIHMRCDDSVVRVAERKIYPIRRSRGYAPAPLTMAQSFDRHILACGGELKNTFCLAKNRYAFLSHYIGDLENYQTLRSFREGIEHYCELFDIHPEIVAYDLHPEYLSTKYAQEMEEAGLPAIGIQHHHAHIAGCLAENRCPPETQAIGVALDGTGYGTDGAIWGGEFLAGSIRDGFVRCAHLAYAPLPGGAAAIRESWRSTVAHLLPLFGEEQILQLPLPFLPAVGDHSVRVVAQLIRTGLNTPPTSSAGRLFDAIAALLGVPGSLRTTYEGQAAIELELAAHGPTTRSYPFLFREEGDDISVETSGIIAGVIEDLLAGVPAGEIAARFHRTMAEIVVAGCDRIRRENGIQTVALSGGTFQNMLLLGQTVQLLEDRGFLVYLHRRVPANDGGISLGQAVLADSITRSRSVSDVGPRSVAGTRSCLGPDVTP